MRMLSESYSASSQSDLQGRPFSRETFLGSLRLDTLVARTVVLPDTHLFDGSMFLSCVPVSLIANLGGSDLRPAIEIQTRASSLDESLRQFFIRPSSDYLNPFPLYFISDADTRTWLSSELGCTSAVELTRRIHQAGSVTAGIADLLRELLHQRGGVVAQIDELESGWNRWIDAVRKGVIATRQWDRSLRIGDAIALDPIDAEAELGSKEATTLLRNIENMVGQGSSYRSDVINLMNAALIDATPAGGAEIAGLEAWYRQARHRAMATQHGAFLSRTLGADRIFGGYARAEALANVLGDRTPYGLEFAEVDLHSILAEFPDDAYRSLVRKTWPRWHRWWESGRRNDLQAAFESTLEQTGDGGLPGRNGLTMMFASAVGGAIGSQLGGPLGAAAGSAATWYVSSAVKAHGRKRRACQIVEALGYSVDTAQ